MPSQRTFNFITDLQLSPNNDFGIQVIQGVTDMSIVMSNSSAPRPGFALAYSIDYKNNGTLASNGVIKFTLDPNIQFNSSSVAPSIINGNYYEWNYTSLDPGVAMSIKLDLTIPIDVTLLGKTLSSDATVVADQIDVSAADNTFSIKQIVVGSYDPNDKQVTPAGTGDEGYIEPTTKELLYTIRFQNMGNADAVNIVIKDQLDPNVEVSSFKMKTASHNYEYKIENGEVKWSFKNIHLPDSHTDEPGSHGYVTYSVSLKPNLPVGTIVQNEADIYFDFNPAVPTNVVVNTIARFPQSITFNAFNNNYTYGDANITLTATGGDSGNPIIYSSSDPSIAQIVNGNQIKIVGAGSANISASQAGNVNYFAAQNVTQTLVINKKDLTITANDASRTYGATNPTFTVRYSGFANGEDASALTNQPKITCEADAFTPAGTLSIVPAGAVSSNYNFIYQNGTLTINKANQTTTFDAPASRTMGDAAFSLEATTSSGLPVSYTASSTNATISGNQVTLNQAGRVTITATQSGNNNYNAASNVSQSFCINPSKPVITLFYQNFNGGVESLTLLAISNVAKAQWYLDGNEISGAISGALPIAQEGSYTVELIADDCHSAMSEPQSIVITGLEAQPEMKVLLYPNPSQSAITLSMDPKMIGEQSVRVVLLDMLGNELKNGSTEMLNNELNITGYPSGVYLVKVAIGETTKVIRFVKK